VQIIPREDSETAVGLSWRETILSEVEKEASRLYLFDEGFIEHAIGALEPDKEIERFRPLSKPSASTTRSHSI